MPKMTECNVMIIQDVLLSMFLLHLVLLGIRVCYMSILSMLVHNLYGLSCCGFFTILSRYTHISCCENFMVFDKYEFACCSVSVLYITYSNRGFWNVCGSIRLRFMLLFWFLITVCPHCTTFFVHCVLF